MDFSIRAPRRSSTGGLRGRREGEEADVILLAGGATFEVRAHARDLLDRRDAGELELDVTIELVEALFARQLRAGGPRSRSSSGGACWSG